MKSSISLMLAISFGVIGSFATHTFRLEVMRNPISGCVNTPICSYGCSKFSTSSVNHSLAPLCQTKALSDDSPKNLTIRGTSMRPYLYDEDLQVKFECSRIRSNDGAQFLCTQIEEDPVALNNNSSSSSAMMSRTLFPQTSSSSASASVMYRRTRSSSSPSSAFTSPSSRTCIDSPSVYNMNYGNGNLNDCCRTSNDCHGSCIKGACDAENNKPPPPACTINKYFGKNIGKGPDGVCCETQLDCLESCVAGVCLTLN